MVADLPGYRGYAYSESGDRTRHHPFLNFILAIQNRLLRVSLAISLTHHNTVSPRHSDACEEIHCETHNPVESHSAGRRHVIARHRGGGRSDCGATAATRRRGDGGDGGDRAVRSGPRGHRRDQAGLGDHEERGARRSGGSRGRQRDGDRERLSGGPGPERADRVLDRRLHAREPAVRALPHRQPDHGPVRSEQGGGCRGRGLAHRVRPGGDQGQRRDRRLRRGPRFAGGGGQGLRRDVRRVPRGRRDRPRAAADRDRPGRPRGRRARRQRPGHRQPPGEALRHAATAAAELLDGRAVLELTTGRRSRSPSPRRTGSPSRTPTAGTRPGRSAAPTGSPSPG